MPVTYFPTDLINRLLFCLVYPVTQRVTGIMKDEGNDDEKPKVRSTISLYITLK